MPWKEVTLMSQRQEFVQLALQPDVSFSQLCRRFQISRKTGYKFVRRVLDQEGLEDRSRCPHHSPGRTPTFLEEQVIALRLNHPAWGARKLRHRLQALGQTGLPCPSTITAILARHGLLGQDKPLHPGPFERFERAAPNELWQMDFKGPFETREGPCHPLSVLDDHSRFALQLKACTHQRTALVQSALQEAFERYGLPWGILMDNGSPWSGGPAFPYTPLSVWLIRLGIGVHHGRPYHPQTQGKDERFHRTLKTELLRDRAFRSLEECQQALDQWRDCYNQERPHEALGMATPLSRYHLSPRAYPAVLPPIEYGPDDQVRKVQQDGTISFQGHPWRVGKAFFGYPVGVRPRSEGEYEVFFCHQSLRILDLTQPGSEAEKV